MGKKILDFIGQYVIAMIGIFISSVLFWNFSPDDTIPITTFMCFVISLGIYAIITIPQQMKYWTAENRKVSFPKLKTITDNTYIFESSDLFSQGSLVTLFFNDDELERCIGTGYVEVVNSSSNCLQIKLIEIYHDYNDTFLCKNKKFILIKPNFSYDSLQNFIENRKDSNNE